MVSHKTRKNVPWKGWSKIQPKGKQRTIMYKKCGKKCFLGKITRGNKKHPDFPICKKGTCRISKKGLWAAYIRSKQWGKPYRSYKTKSKMTHYNKKNAKTKRIHYKGSRPTHKRSYYTTISRKAKRMLKNMGIKVGK